MERKQTELQGEREKKKKKRKKEKNRIENLFSEYMGISHVQVDCTTVPFSKMMLSASSLATSAAGMWCRSGTCSLNISTLCLSRGSFSAPVGSAHTHHTTHSKICSTGSKHTNTYTVIACRHCIQWHQAHTHTHTHTHTNTHTHTHTHTHIHTHTY